MSNEFSDVYLLRFFADKLQLPGRFLRERFTDDGDFKKWLKREGHADTLKTADIDYDIGSEVGIRRMSTLLLRLDTTEKLGVVGRMLTDRIQLQTFASYQKAQQVRRQRFLYNREFEEMDDIPSKIAELQKRYQELRDKYVTRLWLTRAQVEVANLAGEPESKSILGQVVDAEDAPATVDDWSA